MITMPAISNFTDKVLRKLNRAGFFIETDKSIKAILAGYTRSGTTYISDLVSRSAQWRMIHEPMNPTLLNHLRDRDSADSVRISDEAMGELKYVLSEDYGGSRSTNHGTGLVYRGRMVKLVRANFMLDLIHELLPELPIIFVIRNPCACVASRMALGWTVPDMNQSNYQFRSSLEEECYHYSSSVHVRMAATWCMDNRTALETVQEIPTAVVIKYENFLQNPVSITYKLLLSINLDDSITEERIRKADMALHPGGSFSPSAAADKWKRLLSKEQISDIARVTEIFGLENLYPEIRNYQ